MYLRTNFGSSGLVRLLDELEDASGVKHPGPDQDLAQTLSQWVGVVEAGTLHAAHQAAGAVPLGSTARTSQASGVRLEEQLRQTHALLKRAIIASGSLEKDAHRGGSRPEDFTTAREAEPDFAPYQQRYLHQQRNMVLMISALRENVRKSLSAASPALRQLAALDAVWEQMLQVREHRLLSALPLRLKRRFERMRQANVLSRDGPLDVEPVNWLRDFERELEEVLLAELDMRLQPVTGLIEAFEQEGKNR
jgi:hypothetical protein